jgi:hypothetical protein
VNNVVGTVASLPCFQHVQLYPDRGELRRFGWWMLGGFAVLGGIGVWRTGAFGAGPLTLWAIGVILAASSFSPALGRVSYLAVYLISGVVGYIVSRVILTMIFYLVFMPIGFVLRARGRDLLQLGRPPDGSMWIRHRQRIDRDSYYRQF